MKILHFALKKKKKKKFNEIARILIILLAHNNFSNSLNNNSTKLLSCEINLANHVTEGDDTQNVLHACDSRFRSINLAKIAGYHAIVRRRFKHWPVKCQFRPFEKRYPYVLDFKFVVPVRSRLFGRFIILTYEKRIACAD